MEDANFNWKASEDKLTLEKTPLRSTTERDAYQTITTLPL